MVAILLAASGFACKGTPPLAELIERGGTAERDSANAQEQWTTAPVGATFNIGDGLRTAAKSSALLRVRRGARMKVEAETSIRFSASDPGQPETENVAIEMGQVVLEAGTESLSFRSQGGMAVLTPGSRLRIGRAQAIARYEVLFGAAHLKSGDQPGLDLVPGSRIEVNIETARIDKIDKADKPEPVAAGEPVAAPTPAPVPSVAVIEIEVFSRTSRFRNQGSTNWRTLAIGRHTLPQSGDLEIPERGRVRVVRGDDNAMLTGRGRFVLGDPEVLIRADLGQVSVGDARGEVRVRVPGGSIVIKPGAEPGGSGNTNVKVGADASAEIRVQKGLASVQTERTTGQLRAGEKASLSDDGRMTVAGVSATRADVTVAAGESFVIHDPRPPTAVGVAVDGICKGGEVRVRLAGSRVVEPTTSADGKVGAAVAVLAPGRHHYQVECRRGDSWTGKPTAAGTAQVIRDGGKAKLPRSAPGSFIDTDGRKYTVLYQNLLPSILVRWTDAARATSYTLTIRSASGNGKPLSITSKNARYQLASGKLPEGTHIVRFGTGGADPIWSAETTLTIGFDNAAPTAVVKSPEDRGFAGNEPITVAGSALPGWKVSAFDAPLALDAQNRFAGQVHLDPTAAALAVRFEHRDRGVHYYLRRPRRATP